MVESRDDNFAARFTEGGGNARASPFFETGPSLFEQGGEGGGRIGRRGGPWRSPNRADYISARLEIGPARFKFKKVGARDCCGDVNEEGDVVGRETREGR